MRSPTWAPLGGPASRSPTTCSTTVACAVSPVRPSAATARATCASATRTRRPTSARRWSASRPAWPSSNGPASSRRRHRSRPMTTVQPRTTDRLFEEAERSFEHWELLRELIDESIDLALNYRQSGHPGGSRSKVHLFLALMLSGAMRWDLRRPWRPFGDRFILSAGHTVPLIYATLATLNEALRVRHERTPDERYAFPFDGKFALTWEDLLGLRRHGGLPGHAEMAGKTLFLKWNTGPSGHGMPPTVGEAVALKIAGAERVKVFAVEGEGGLTPGASHETRNSAWGLGLSNLVFLLDWNDFGIDVNAVSSVVHGGPRDWFEPYGWRVVGTEQG